MNYKNALLSIIVINKNDRAIAETLKALRSLDKFIHYEIIVVDGSNGELNDIARQFPDVLWVPFRNKKNKRITIPEQRNVGIRAAKGKIIAFTDANCIPNKDWLKELVKPITDSSESIVAGRVISRGGATIHDRIYEEYKDKNYINECPTINLAFTKKLYEEVGKFDEKFDYGSDVEFSWRVIDSGYRIYYQKQAIVSHDWGTGKQELKRSFLYGAARARLYIKHKTRVRSLCGKDFPVIAYPIFIIGLPITYWLSWYPLLLLVPFIKNINQHPLETIADHLVYGLGVMYEVVNSIGD